MHSNNNFLLIDLISTSGNLGNGGDYIAFLFFANTLLTRLFVRYHEKKILYPTSFVNLISNLPKYGQDFNADWSKISS